MTELDESFLRAIPVAKEQDILETYQISHPIGQGSFSTIYLATRKPTAHPSFQLGPERIALKVTRRRQDLSKELKVLETELISQELATTKRFEAAGLELFFIAVSQEAVTMGMELAGERLPVKRPFTEYPLWKRMADLLVIAKKAAMLEGEGQVHNDLKVENILMKADGEPALVDFGLSTCHGLSMPKRGSPAYMPPEGWEGLYVSDVWAIGILAYLTIFEGREPTLSEEGQRDLWMGAWMRPWKDTRYRAAQRVGRRSVHPSAGRRARGRRTWVREYFGLMDEMLAPDWRERIGAAEAVCRLEKLNASLDWLGAPELEALLSKAMRKADGKDGSCMNNKIFTYM